MSRSKSYIFIAIPPRTPQPAPVREILTESCDLYTSGYICAAIPESRATSLDLPKMVKKTADPYRTAYTITIDAPGLGVSTGISAHDRAHTCRSLALPSAIPSSFRRPGHILPLRALDGGVRARFGHTEAAVELCRLAGKQPAAAL